MGDVEAFPQTVLYGDFEVAWAGLPCLDLPVNARPKGCAVGILKGDVVQRATREREGLQLFEGEHGFPFEKRELCQRPQAAGGLNA